MKQLLMVSLLLASFNCFSQMCNFYLLQNNKTIEVSFKNKKGKDAGKQVYTVSNVVKSGNTTTAAVNSEFFTDKGKSASKATNNIKCVNGVLMMDMKVFIPSPQQEQMGTAAASASDVYLEYPADMKEGDVLKDGNFNMDFKNSAGMNGNVVVNITERKVLGKESVTTPAGTWECFKISSRNEIKIKLIVGIPVRADVIEWYAPGFGIVKTDANGATTEVTLIK